MMGELCYGINSQHWSLVDHFGLFCLESAFLLGAGYGYLESLQAPRLWAMLQVFWSWTRGAKFLLLSGHAMSGFIDGQANFLNYQANLLKSW